MKPSTPKEVADEVIKIYENMRQNIETKFHNKNHSKPSTTKQLTTNSIEMKVQRKPMLFDAVQFKTTMNPLPQMFMLYGMPYIIYLDSSSHFPFIWVTTNEGMQRAYQYDYILKGHKGDLHIVKSWDFEESYEVLNK